MMSIKLAIFYCKKKLLITYTSSESVKKAPGVPHDHKIDCPSLLGAK